MARPPSRPSLPGAREALERQRVPLDPRERRPKIVGAARFLGLDPEAPPGEGGAAGGPAEVDHRGEAFPRPHAGAPGPLGAQDLDDMLVEASGRHLDGMSRYRAEVEGGEPAGVK